jgi:hypothetical protein
MNVGDSNGIFSVEKKTKKKQSKILPKEEPQKFFTPS